VPFAGDGETINFPTCGMLYPSGLLAICCDLNNFVEDYFPAAYKERAEKAQSFSGNFSLIAHGTCTNKANSIEILLKCFY
jgi:hypothetical protein